MPKLINIVLDSQRLFIYHWTEAKDLFTFTYTFNSVNYAIWTTKVSRVLNYLSIFWCVIYASQLSRFFPHVEIWNWMFHFTVDIKLTWSSCQNQRGNYFSLVLKQPFINAQLKNREASLSELNPQSGRWHPRRCTEQHWVIYSTSNSLDAAVLCSKT